MKRKAQIQMMETIVVLLIFMVLVGLGLMFFSRIMRSSASDQASEIQDLSSIQIAQIASTLPEIQCSEDNIVKANCVDWIKVQKANPIINNNINDYFPLLAYSTITIVEFDILGTPTSETLYDNNPGDLQDTRTTQFPISIYHPIDPIDTYMFGYIEVKVYT